MKLENTKRIDGSKGIVIVECTVRMTEFEYLKFLDFVNENKRG